MIVLMDFWERLVDFFVNEGWDIVLAISVLIIAFVGIKIIVLLLTKLLYKSTIDGSAIAFYIALVKVALWIIAIFAVANVLSIPTSSLIVGLSSVALAVTLALKDSLSNLANGIIMIYNKSFRRGDLIEIDGVEGRIKNIKLLTSEIITADNRRIILPNSKMVNGVIINKTSMSTRRITFTFYVSYDADVTLVEEVLRKTFESDKRINRRPRVDVYMSQQKESSLEFTVKCWVDTEYYWPIYNGMNQVVFAAFKENNIQVPYNQLDVHIKNDERGESHE